MIVLHHHHKLLLSFIIIYDQAFCRLLRCLGTTVTKTLTTISRTREAGIQHLVGYERFFLHDCL